MLVLKKNVHKPGHFQYTIHHEGKSFSCPRTQKVFTSYYMHFSSFKICSLIFLASAILHYIPLLRLLPKSYFKISTFQHSFLCPSFFKGTFICTYYLHIRCLSTMKNVQNKFAHLNRKPFYNRMSHNFLY